MTDGTLTCQFCGLTGDIEDFEVDGNGIGFWCEECDGFTYLNNDSNKHSFILILEDKIDQVSQSLSSTSKLKFNKRLSPFRYPGGKSKMIDYLYSYLRTSKSKKLISPFTGGGSFELAMLDVGVVESLHLNDLDTGIFSFWWVVKHIPFVLIDRIKSELPSHSDYFAAQTIIKRNYVGVDVVDAAWASLVVNRLAYSGIPRANPLGGKNGSSVDLLSRWNPKELIKRIEYIHLLSDRITITQINAVELIEEAYWHDDATIFIDPPYVIKGKDLYPCYYTEDDHRNLSFLLDTLYMGCPGADLIVTYDYTPWLNNLYSYPDREIIGRKYSA